MMNCGAAIRQVQPFPPIIRSYVYISIDIYWYNIIYNKIITKSLSLYIYIYYVNMFLYEAYLHIYIPKETSSYIHMPPPLRSYVFDGSTNKKYRSATQSADKSAVGSVRQFDKRALETKWQSLNTAFGLLSRSRWFCILQYSFKREQSWLSKATALQDVGNSWNFYKAKLIVSSSTCSRSSTKHVQVSF